MSDPAAFRAALGAWATGVAVVTCAGSEGPAGLTTSAFTSVSLHPPLVLVCLDRSSRTLVTLREAGHFAVNILRADQAGLAAVFASKAVAAEKFANAPHREEHGVPVLDGALAWVACEAVDLRDAGDHVVATGLVVASWAAGDGEPLRYFRGVVG